MSCLETPKKLMSNEPLNRTVPCILVGNFISSHLGKPRTQYSPTVPVQISINAFWHRRTEGDFVLAVWSAVRAAWLSEQLLKYSISWTQSNIAYISAWKTIVYFPRKMLCFMSTDCPQNPVPLSFTVLDPSVYHTNCCTAGGMFQGLWFVPL